MWHTPVSMISPWNFTPRPSSTARVAATSSTCSAMWFGLTACLIPIFSALYTLKVRLPVSYSEKWRSGR